MKPVKEKKITLLTINNLIRPRGLTLIREDIGFSFIGHYTDQLTSSKTYVPVDSLSELPLESWIKEAEKVYKYIQEIKNAERKQFEHS